MKLVKNLVITLALIFPVFLHGESPMEALESILKQGTSESEAKELFSHPIVKAYLAKVAEEVEWVKGLSNGDLKEKKVCFSGNYKSSYDCYLALVQDRMKNSPLTLAPQLVMTALGVRVISEDTQRELGSVDKNSKKEYLAHQTVSVLEMTIVNAEAIDKRYSAGPKADINVALQKFATLMKAGQKDNAVRELLQMVDRIAYESFQKNFSKSSGELVQKVGSKFGDMSSADRSRYRQLLERLRKLTLAAK